jgi:hypothetical protein
MFKNGRWIAISTEGYIVSPYFLNGSQEIASFKNIYRLKT